MRNRPTQIRFLHLMLFSIVSCSLIFFSCKKKAETTKETGEKKWKLCMVKYEDLQQTEDAEKGISSGLRDAGLIEGKDYELTTKSAQGDMPTVLNLIDAALTEGCDMIISLQTPTLHAAVERGRSKPIVFMVIANPFVISAMGNSDSLHLPNITGVYTMNTFDKMLGYIRECIPHVKRIGSLYAVPELNAQFYKGSLQEAAAKTGIEVELVGVTTRLEVPEAALALCSKKIDAICQIEDNLTSATFPSIIQAAQKNKLPVFSFVNSQARNGAVMAIAPDYYGGATDAANSIARIIRGENPKNIPFQRIKKFPLLVNVKAAKELGITIPSYLVSQADEVIGK